MTFVQHVSTSIISSFLTLFMALPAQAQTTPTTLPSQSTSVFQDIAVSGASNFDNTTNPSQPIIIGGYTGDIGECASATTGTCNACTALTTVCDTSPTVVSHCAERSITQNTLLTITFTITTLPANAATIVVKTGSMATTSGLGLQLVSQPTLVAGSPITIQLPWGEICGVEGNNGISGTCSGGTGVALGFTDTLSVSIADAGGNVSGGVTQNFTLKFSYSDPSLPGTANSDASSAYAGGVTPFQPGCISSSSPFCEYTLGNGDEKVYVDNLLSNSVGPNDGSQVKWNSARLYFVPYGSCSDAICTPPTSPVGFCAVDLSSATRADLFVKDKTLSSTGGSYGVDSRTIDGLQNDQAYVFVLATQDEASIVGGFMDSGQFAKNASCMSGALDGSCPYLGFPGKVIGLLSDQKCFIATAAYGSPMEPHVMILRHFRNQFLLTNSIGTWFVHTYYRLSPPFANWIAQHETARSIARAVLWPAVWFAEWMTGEHLSEPAKAETGAKK